MIMASSKEYLDFVLEQLSGLDDIIYNFEYSAPRRRAVNLTGATPVCLRLNQPAVASLA
jgi:hypothetical protein